MGEVLMLCLTYLWAEVFNLIPELHFLKQAGSTVKPSLFYGTHCSKKGKSGTFSLSSIEALRAFSVAECVNCLLKTELTYLRVTYVQL